MDPDLRRCLSGSEERVVLSTSPTESGLYASDRAVGAVLSQTESDGLDHAVANFRKKLLPREENYSTVE